MPGACLRRTIAAGLLALPAAAVAASPTDGAAAAGNGRAPDGYDRVRGELRIGADVLDAALRETLPGALRVVDLETGYLAGQGVLVIVDLASPWLQMAHSDTHPEITRLEDIPDLVQEVLNDLDLGLSRRELEALTELREVREATRAVRAERRALRAQLRELRRRRLSAEDGGLSADDDRKVRLDTDISALEAALAAAADQERTLERDAERLRATLDSDGPEGAAAPAGDADLSHAVAQSVCRYGATFRSLDGDERLNVVVRQGDESHYFVFTMNRVRDCRAGTLSEAGLLDASLRYAR